MYNLFEPIEINPAALIKNKSTDASDLYGKAILLEDIEDCFNNYFLIKKTQARMLKYFLDKEFMTQKELALRIDVSEKHISNIIKGKTKITNKLSLQLRYVFKTNDFYFSNLPFE